MAEEKASEKRHFTWWNIRLQGRGRIGRQSCVWTSQSANSAGTEGWHTSGSSAWSTERRGCGKRQERRAWQPVDSIPIGTRQAADGRAGGLQPVTVVGFLPGPSTGQKLKADASHQVVSDSTQEYKKRKISHSVFASVTHGRRAKIWEKCAKIDAEGNFYN